MNSGKVLNLYQSPRRGRIVGCLAAAIQAMIRNERLMVEDTPIGPDDRLGSFGRERCDM